MQRGSFKSILLVTVSGKDQPGITAEVTGILAGRKVTVIDIGQAVIGNLLSLSILFEVNLVDSHDHETILKDLLFRTNQLGLKLDFQVIEPTVGGQARSPRLYHYAVTLIAERISAEALHHVTARIAQSGMNIDVIKRLSEDEFGCVELQVSSPGRIDPETVRKELIETAAGQQVDIAIQAEGLYRRAKRLVVMDMDSTLIQSEVIDELAREKGVFEQVASITHRAMSGEIDFETSLKLRCEKLQGLLSEDLERVFQRIQLTPGAKDLIQILKKLGYKTALISGGFSFVADRLKEALGMDFAYANTLEVQDGKLTGNLIPPLITAQRKADLLDVIAHQEKIQLDQVIAIGDGANDLLMLEKAGLGIAFNAKPAVRERAAMALSQKNMRSILYLLGMSGRELSELVA